MPGVIIAGLNVVFMVITAILMAVYNLPAVQSAGSIAGNPKA